MKKSLASLCLLLGLLLVLQGCSEEQQEDREIRDFILGLNFS
jgi:hypothetical protein